jgi:penicillin-binding protein 1C
LRIVFPRNGDVFVANRTASRLQATEQELALRAVSPSHDVRWSANGNAVPLDASGTAFWPVKPGVWTFEANDGRRTDMVTIRVVPAGHDAHPGFTSLRPEPYCYYRC